MPVFSKVRGPMKKYIVIIGDGMAGWPMADYNNQTSLERALIPNMDYLVKYGTIGLVKTVPDLLPPGSDVANLSVFGYDPLKYYTGRAPIEAVSLNIVLGDHDTVFRANLVYINENNIMADFTAGHIKSEDAQILIQDLNLELQKKYPSLSFYPGVSYRNLMLANDEFSSIKTTPPHDITGKDFREYLPVGEKSEVINNVMNDCSLILENHQLNKTKKAKNEIYANALWLWGEGKKVNLPKFKETYGLSGAVITAVDLVKGLGLAASMEYIKVPGITGFIDTNYAGKAEYALNALNNHDIVFVHIEAPDEAGHMGNESLKKEAIEHIDKEVVGRILQEAHRFNNLSILVLPDHETPIEIKTHTSNPVPFVMYNTKHRALGAFDKYSEKVAVKSGIMVDPGSSLLDFFINKFS